MEAFFITKDYDSILNQINSKQKNKNNIRKKLVKVLNFLA